MARGPKRAQREARPGTVFPSEAVARNVRAYRGVKRWKQLDLAERMSDLGLEWTAGTVGFVERYERVVTVDEYVGLSLCFGIPVGALLDPSGPGHIDTDGFDLIGTDAPALAESEAKGFLDVTEARKWASRITTVRFEGGTTFEVQPINPGEKDEENQ